MPFHIWDKNKQWNTQTKKWDHIAIPNVTDNKLSKAPTERKDQVKHNNGANTHPQNRVVIQALPVMGLSASPLARKWSSFHRLCHCLATYIVMFDWLMIAYIALFSALVSRLTVLSCGSTWVTSFMARFFKISTEVVYLQCWHDWCHMKLQPSRHKFCVHHTTMLHVTSCKATCVCASIVAEFQPSSYM